MPARLFVAVIQGSFGSLTLGPAFGCCMHNAARLAIREHALVPGVTAIVATIHWLLLFTLYWVFGGPKGNTTAGTDARVERIVCLVGILKVFVIGLLFEATKIRMIVQATAILPKTKHATC